MNNIEKKLDALIDALGFDVSKINVNPRKNDRYPSEPIYDYRLTKRAKLTDEQLMDLRKAEALAYSQGAK